MILNPYSLKHVQDYSGCAYYACGVGVTLYHE